MHVVAVTFQVRPASWTDFRAAVLANAAESLRLEPECRRFDVCEDAGGHAVFLYEVYDDAAAFERHLLTEHFLRFATLTESWVSGKVVSRYERVTGEGAEA